MQPQKGNLVSMRLAAEREVGASETCSKLRGVSWVSCSRLLRVAGLCAASSLPEQGMFTARDTPGANPSVAQCIQAPLNTPAAA